MDSTPISFASGNLVASTSSMEVDMPIQPVAPTQLSFPPNMVEETQPTPVKSSKSQKKR